MTLETGSQVWAELCKRGGVDISYYDLELELDLKSRFSFDTNQSLMDSLENNNVNATEFLVELFGVARPFIFIFQSILETAERIAATQGRDNLQIHFDFRIVDSLKLVP
ncbi:MAG: hypothetical protein KDJ52_32025 [Anaerolineae bacterium]|nr:hypothetical protein [Anaerolineae bacterium]